MNFVILLMAQSRATFFFANQRFVWRANDGPADGYGSYDYFPTCEGLAARHVG